MITGQSQIVCKYFKYKSRIWLLLHFSADLQLSTFVYAALQFCATRGRKQSVITFERLYLSG